MSGDPGTDAAMAVREMSDLDFDPRHKDDFDRVYDLEDPAPYFLGLRPVDYRMPHVMTGFLRAGRDLIAAARGHDGTLSVLDFACGYGANGALLKHDLALDELYAHFASRAWAPDLGRTHWDHDRTAFARRRRPGPGIEIAGIDVAAVALEYALHVGFLDAAFDDDLVGAGPGEGLGSWLARADIVTEAGAVGAMLPAVFGHLLDAACARPPWFLYCPRPDVDWSELEALWVARGYVAEPVNRERIRYRRALGPREEAEAREHAKQFGLAPDEAMSDGYLLVDMMLARPLAERGHPPIEALSACVPA